MERKLIHKPMKTRSEEILEAFLAANAVSFQKIAEDTTHRPDYLVSLGEARLILEVKELAEDDKFGVVDDPARPYIKSFSGTIGEHVRRRIAGSKKQIQYGAKQGIPSVLLIYNLLDRAFQDFGTSDLDFVAAMYGELTIAIDKGTQQTSEIFNGKNQSLQAGKNTSFSAVGRLRDRNGKTTVTLFENVYAQVRLPVEHLPRCFDLWRAEISTDPLSFH
jgi:hypothetical protein